MRRTACQWALKTKMRGKLRFVMNKLQRVRNGVWGNNSPSRGMFRDDYFFFFLPENDAGGAPGRVKSQTE